MPRPLLGETLEALVQGVVGTQVPPTITMEVIIDVPMEVELEVDAAGSLVFRAAPGHTRFVSGLLPPLHRTQLTIVAMEES